MQFINVLRSSRRRPARNRSGRRLRFEPLESRHLLATFMVTNFDDAGPGSLRQAVLDANAAAGADEVRFQAELRGTIQLTSGQIDITGDLAITGPGARELTIDAQRNSRILQISGADVTLDGLTLSFGQETGESGGGAIHADATSALTIQNSAVTGNASSSDGGAIRASQLIVIRSTIWNNHADGNGGGIFGSDVTVINSTISGNSAGRVIGFSGGDGGGILVTGSLSVFNSTIVGNHASLGSGGGIFAQDADQVTIRSSIIAANFGPSGFCPAHLFGPCLSRSSDVARSAAIDITHSLIGVNMGTGLDEAPVGSPDENGNLVGSLQAGIIDPMLERLQDNGGPTATHLLLAGSPAIDAGTNPARLFTDQRGSPRQIGEAVDMGAVEGARRIFVVNSTGDAGDVNRGDGICDDGAGNCTLRAAIEEANALANGDFADLILFDIPGGGVRTIRPTSELPAITDPVVIDAGRLPSRGLGARRDLVVVALSRIELDGSLAGDGASGFTIKKNGSGSTIQSLAIFGFDEHGVFLSRSSDNRIEFVYSGTDRSGAAGLGNGDAGVFVLNGARNTMTRSVLSGNRRGIVIAGKASRQNTISNNLIGSNPFQLGALGNQRAGIEIAGAADNVIGGSNVIVANRVGIDIRGRGATNNLVRDNEIGLAPSRLIPIGSSVVDSQFQSLQVRWPGNRIGVQLRDGAEGNTLLGNTIANNLDDGVRIRRSNANILLDNNIGDDSRDNVDTGNGGDGVDIRQSENNRIGGRAAIIPIGNDLSNVVYTAGNVISGNGGFGINLMGDANRVHGNRIGTDADAVEAVPNTRGGIQIAGGSNNEIARLDHLFNVISGNRGPGIMIRRAVATGNLVAGNLIGTDRTGLVALPNDVGVDIREARDNVIGGAGFENTNVISGNRRQGVVIRSGATGNQVLGNSIGVEQFTRPDRACTISKVNLALCVILDPSPPETLAAIGNGREGVLVESDGNTIGGISDGTGNLISSNGRDGIRLAGDANVVQGNLIGTDALGTGAMPNGRDGVRVLGSHNAIGGAEEGAANVIAFNVGSGVRVAHGTGNAVVQNSTFANGGLGIDLGRMGSTPNDGPLDADAGANRLQNTPEILRAQQTATDLQIIFHVPSQTPHSTFPLRVEFFAADDDGREGKTLLAATEVVLHTPAVISIPLADLPPGARIVATATDADGNTSEFSAPFAIAARQEAAAADAVFDQFGAE